MSQENVEVVRRATDAANRRHYGAMLEFYDPEIADTLENFETFELHIELRDLGAQVLAWGTIHLRGRGSGVEMDVPTGGIFEIRQGKIVRWRDFGSKEKATEAAGRRE